MNKHLLQMLNKNYKFLFRIIYKTTKKIDETEDILQDVYIKVLQNDYFLNNKQLLPWCITVAKNTMINYMRKNRKNNIITEADMDFDLIGTLASSDNEYGYSELKIILNDYLSTLHPSIQQGLYLNIFENKSIKQISILLNIDYEKIRHIIWQAKKNLRAIIKMDL